MILERGDAQQNRYISIQTTIEKDKVMYQSCVMI